MKNLRGKKSKKLVAGALSIFLFVMIAAPHQLSAGQCEKAFIRCLFDAGIVAALGAIAGLFSASFVGSLLGAAAAGSSYATMCLVGFDFCLSYFDDLENDAEK